MKRRVSLALLSSVVLLGCDDARPPARSDTSKAKQSLPATQNSKAKAPQPRRVLDLDVSAYRARIAFDGETLVVATSRGLHMLPPDGPASVTAQDFGDTFALAGSRVVFFRQGQLLESKRGSTPAVLGVVKGAPRAIALDLERIAWVQATSDGGSTIWTARDGHVASVARLGGRVDTVAVMSGWAFFFEHGEAGQWRLGGVSLDGGAPVFREWQQGRTPATLAAPGDLFYYDGPSRSVRRVSPDLGREDVLATGVICSPLAVSDRVVCAHVGGLSEVPFDGGPPQKLLVQGSMTASLAANAHSVAWLADSGQDELVVRVLDLPQR